MTQRSYKIHFVVTDCCRQHSWRYAANTLSCSLGMCVYILCTLFMWRCSTFGFTKGGLTREAPSETMKGIKWYIQIQMRGHTSSYYTPCSCTDCRREHCVLSKHYSGLHLKEEIKKKRLNLKLETSNMKQNIDLIRRSVCLFTWLESWRGGRSVRWATKLAVPWSHFNILLDKQKK